MGCSRPHSLGLNSVCVSLFFCSRSERQAHSSKGSQLGLNLRDNSREQGMAEHLDSIRISASVCMNWFICVSQRQAHRKGGLLRFLFVQGL